MRSIIHHIICRIKCYLFPVVEMIEWICLLDNVVPGPEPRIAVGRRRECAVARARVLTDDEFKAY